MNAIDLHLLLEQVCEKMVLEPNRISGIRGDTWHAIGKATGALFQAKELVARDIAETK